MQTPVFFIPCILYHPPHVFFFLQANPAGQSPFPPPRTIVLWQGGRKPREANRPRRLRTRRPHRTKISLHRHRLPSSRLRPKGAVLHPRCHLQRCFWRAFWLLGHRFRRPQVHSDDGGEPALHYSCHRSSVDQLGAPIADREERASIG